MSLEDTFGKVEKIPREKKLEVVASVSSVVDDLRAYFEKNKYEGDVREDMCRTYFGSCVDFLKSFELTPKMIREFSVRVKCSKDRRQNESRRIGFGIYLSALIQTSYDKGFDDFSFEEVNANFFGTFLEGQPENPIKIIVNTLKGDDSLCYAKNCTLTAKTIKGDYTFWDAKNCSLRTETLKGDYNLCFVQNCLLTAETIEGNDSLWNADSCLVEITNYQGKYSGYIMENCTIYSPNKKVLEKLKKQSKLEEGENNKFELKK